MTTKKIFTLHSPSLLQLTMVYINYWVLSLLDTTVKVRISHVLPFWIFLQRYWSNYETDAIIKKITKRAELLMSQISVTKFKMKVIFQDANWEKGRGTCLLQSWIRYIRITATTLLFLLRCETNFSVCIQE